MIDDARIPVLAAGATPPVGREGATAHVLGAPRAGDAVAAGGAVEHLAAARSGHGTACVCCTPRAALVEALHRLFIRRARGEVAFFSRVIAAASEAEIVAALADPLVASRYRAATATPTRQASAFRCE